MKIGSLTNQIITKDFLNATMDIIAENTSFKFSAIALNGIKGQLGKEFKFVKNIHIKEKSIEVDMGINYIKGNELKKFFNRTINMIGPNYLKLLLAKKLKENEVAYLENLGLSFG